MKPLYTPNQQKVANNINNKSKSIDSFDKEIKDKKVTVYLASGRSIEGVVEKYSRYWIVIVGNNKKFYVNKAWIEYILPDS